MAEYLFHQTGLVEEVFLPGKAILTFLLNGQVQRVLLWVKSFIHQGKLLDKTDSFANKLSLGDVVHFHCHVYDKQSSDNCQWYAAKASKEPVSEATVQPSTKVINRSGYISEVDPGKGVILFDFHEEENRVFFMRSKFFLFGKRLTGKRSLQEFLSENDPLQFDAEMCEPSDENYNCNWFATLVWKGKRPIGMGLGGLLGYTGGATSDPGMEEIASTLSGVTPSSYDEFPTLSLPPGLIDKQGYKAFEVNNNLREGHGNVLKLFNEESGLALWMVRCNTWETVFFHRRNAFLDTVSLRNFDIQESFSEGTSLEISAVPALAEFPCRWIARRVVARC
ncbi:uncharacterized protein LOC123506363 isoform X1 [Portunus trituberculatus]|uniref:uncharacterized protein LOC123506363 isoform X1 n=1 Tax=Portunus trituberculatus TaxID=210409 RepID=UPI001E1D08D4|nr:uncharacterized protein LOC123506363 isoform X1 [Portunus trituberculatus]